MSTHSQNTSVRYIAQIAPVREVTLFGTGDLTFWKNQLREVDLHPVSADGKALLSISAIDSRYKGINFRELSISVCVRQQEGGGELEGYYLAHAFNSSRFFAFVERNFFRTPYHHGRIQVDCRLPASFQVSDKNGGFLRAEMSLDATATRRELTRRNGDHWEGPIFLPRTRPADDRNVFYAKLSGLMHVYPFSSATDVLQIAPSKRHPILQSLIDSQFAGKEWLIRENAIHARSKTFSRNSVGGTSSSLVTPTNR